MLAAGRTQSPLLSTGRRKTDQEEAADTMRRHLAPTAAHQTGLGQKAMRKATVTRRK